MCVSGAVCFPETTGSTLGKPFGVNITQEPSVAALSDSAHEESHGRNPPAWCMWLCRPLVHPPPAPKSPPGREALPVGDAWRGLWQVHSPPARRGITLGRPSGWNPRKDLLTRRTVFSSVREGLPQSSSAGVVAGGGLSRSSRTAPKGFLGMGLSAGPCSASENGCRAKVIDRIPLRALTGSHIQEQKADGKGEEGE